MRFANELADFVNSAPGLSGAKHIAEKLKSGPTQRRTVRCFCGKIRLRGNRGAHNACATPCLPGKCAAIAPQAEQSTAQFAGLVCLFFDPGCARADSFSHNIRRMCPHQVLERRKGKLQQIADELESVPGDYGGEGDDEAQDSVIVDRFLKAHLQDSRYSIDEVKKDIDSLLFAVRVSGLL